MKKLYTLLLLSLLHFSNGCAPVIVMGPTHPSEPHKEHRSIHIPKGHMPPPGHCRIWYPDKPAGQQPLPQRCPIPLNQIPLGAYVVSRIDGDNKQVLVKVCHQVRPGVVVDTQYVPVSDN